MGRSASVARRDWRTILGWTALAFAALEVVSAFFIEFPVAAVVFAALFVVGWWILRRFGTAGVIFIGLLCIIELVGLLFYEREDADDWIVQALALVLGVVGVLAVIGALRQRKEPESLA
jgi:FtsH-binding integral membrane protein